MLAVSSVKDKAITSKSKTYRLDRDKVYCHFHQQDYYSIACISQVFSRILYNGYTYDVKELNGVGITKLLKINDMCNFLLMFIKII